MSTQPDVKIADMRHRVVLMQPLRTTDEFGQQVTTWSNTEVWAKVTTKPKDKATPVAGVQLGSIAYTIDIRYRNDVDASWRVNFDGKIMDIATAVDVTGERRFLKITANTVK